MDHQEREASAVAHENRSGAAALWILTLSTGVVAVLLLRLRQHIDPDLWLHLRVGRTIGQGDWFGELPDPLVALADRAYVPTQWLAELGMEAVHAHTGSTGIHAVRALALVALIGLVQLTGREYTSAPRAAAVALVAVTGTAAAWAERPQLVGLVLFAATTWWWSRARVRGTVPWALVPLTWVWAMLHGSWALGVAAGGLFVIAMALEHPRRARPWWRLVLVVAASAAVTLLTPLGVRGALEPLAVGRAASGAVNEWRPPSLDNPLLWLVVLMAVVVLARSVRRLRTSLPELLLALAAVALAATAVRTIAFGALLAVPALAAALAPADQPVPPRTRAELWPLAALAALVLVSPGVVVGAPSGGPVTTAVDRALDAAPAGTVVAVEPFSSGWVLWQHPRLRPLPDLRTEVYSAGTAQAYESFYRAEPGWQTYADAHGVRALVLVDGSPLDAAVAADGGWSEVVRDGGHVVWER